MEKAPYVKICNKPLSSIVSNRATRFLHKIHILYLGIAHSRPSDMREEVDLALLEMREEGMLKALERKWWKGENCEKIQGKYDVYTCTIILCRMYSLIPSTKEIRPKYPTPTNLRGLHIIKE